MQEIIGWFTGDMLGSVLKILASLIGLWATWKVKNWALKNIYQPWADQKNKSEIEKAKEQALKDNQQSNSDAEAIDKIDDTHK